MSPARESFEGTVPFVIRQHPVSIIPTASGWGTRHFKDGYKIWGLCVAEKSERPESTNPNWFLDYALYLRNGLEVRR